MHAEILLGRRGKGRLGEGSDRLLGAALQGSRKRPRELANELCPGGCQSWVGEGMLKRAEQPIDNRHDGLASGNWQFAARNEGRLQIDGTENVTLQVQLPSVRARRLPRDLIQTAAS